MDDTRDLLSKPASKLKMVECKTLLKCRDAEWLEMGAIVLFPFATQLTNTTALVTRNHERIRTFFDFMVRSKVRSSYISRLIAHTNA